MSRPLRLLAFDLGAESGRAIVGTFDGRRLATEEVHRFPNEPVAVHGHLYWDILRLLNEVKKGISAGVAAAARAPGGAVGDAEGLASIGIDTWGVDFALLDEADELICNPYHYRDQQTRGVPEDVFRVVPRETIYSLTGIQFMQINSLYHLAALARRRPALLGAARTLLPIPNLLNFFLTGTKLAEYTIATTTQFYDVGGQRWATDLLESLGIPTGILPRVVPPGTCVGSLSRLAGQELGLPPVKVIAPACHDTASAVAAVPASGDCHAYISCGTWSLVGLELARPVINEAAFKMNFTNEGGVGGTIRFLRNVTGLWLLQECRRAWLSEEAAQPVARVAPAVTATRYSYAELADMAAEAPPFSCLVDPDDPAFLKPEDMPTEIAGFCRRTGQEVPEGKAAMVRCILESLAFKYRWVIRAAEAVTGVRVSAVHVVGGGARNRLLCQFTADATDLPVMAGPAEATAIGNLLVQAMGMGEIGGLSELREVVRESFAVEVYAPRHPRAWDDHYERFTRLVSGAGAP